MQAFHDQVEFLFSLMYFCVRTVIATAFLAHVTYNLWRFGRKDIPVALLVVWTFLIWAVMIGSIPWVQTCYEVLQRSFAGEESTTSSGSGEL